MTIKVNMVTVKFQRANTWHLQKRVFLFGGAGGVWLYLMNMTFLVWSAQTRTFRYISSYSRAVQTSKLQTGGGGINSQDLTYDQQWTIIQVENSTRSFKKLHFQKLGTHISKFVLTQHISYDRDQLFYHKKCNFDYKLKNQGKILPYANVIFHARIKVDKVIVSPMTST